MTYEKQTPEQKAEEARKVDEMARRNYCRTFGHDYELMSDLTAVVCSNRCGMVALTGRAPIDLVKKMFPHLAVIEKAEAALAEQVIALREQFPGLIIMERTQPQAAPKLIVPGSQ